MPIDQIVGDDAARGERGVRALAVRDARRTGAARGRAHAGRTGLYAALLEHEQARDAVGAALDGRAVERGPRPEMCSIAFGDRRQRLDPDLAETLRRLVEGAQQFVVRMSRPTTRSLPRFDPPLISAVGAPSAWSSSSGGRREFRSSSIGAGSVVTAMIVSRMSTTLDAYSTVVMIGSANRAGGGAGVSSARRPFDGTSVGPIRTVLRGAGDGEDRRVVLVVGDLLEDPKDLVGIEAVETRDLEQRPGRPVVEPAVDGEDLRDESRDVLPRREPVIRLPPGACSASASNLGFHVGSSKSGWSVSELFVDLAARAGRCEVYADGRVLGLEPRVAERLRRAEYAPPQGQRVPGSPASISSLAAGRMYVSVSGYSRTSTR